MVANYTEGNPGKDCIVPGPPCIQSNIRLEEEDPLGASGPLSYTIELKALMAVM